MITECPFGRKHGCILLYVLNRAIKRQVVPHFIADIQPLLMGWPGHGKCLDQPVAKVADLARIAAIAQHVLFMTRVPMFETINQGLEHRPLQCLVILCAEDADGGSAAIHKGKKVVIEEWTEYAVADADN